MKHILFICLLAAFPDAFARSSTADCARALSGQVAGSPVFTKFTRLHGDLDGGGEYTLLLKVPRAKHVLAMPGSTKLANPRALTFEKDGVTYHVLHGTADELRRDYAFIRDNNAPGELRYQVLDRVGDDGRAPLLGRELVRRVRVLKYVAAPFLSIDQWLTKHPAYKRARTWIDEKTINVRTAAAERLHRGRNPTPVVNPNVRDDVRAYLNPEFSALADVRENAITGRMNAFFAKHLPYAPGLGYDRALSNITWGMLNILTPERAGENASKISEAKIKDWNFDRLTRDQRPAMLERAWGLIDAAVWGYENRPLKFSTFEIERTMAKFDQMAAADRRLPAERLSLNDWINSNRAAVIMDPTWERLNHQRPLTVINGPDDLRWVLVQADYVRTHSPADVIAEIEREGDHSLSPSVVDQIKRGLKEDGDVLSGAGFVFNPLGEEVLRNIALVQRVHGLRSQGSDRSRVFIVPLALRFMDVETAKDAHGDYVAPERLRRVLEVELSRLMKYAIARNGAFELMHRLWGEAEYQIIRFDYEERPHDRARATVLQVRPIAREAETRHWRLLAEQRGLEDISVTAEGEPKFSFRDRGVTHIQLTPVIRAESWAKFNFALERAQIIELLTTGESVTIDPETRCARVKSADRDYDVCFGSILGKFARIKSIKDAASGSN